MNIGKLNRRITYTVLPAPATDGAGGFTVGSGTGTETWCNAKPLSQSQQLLNGLSLGQSSYEFMFRYEKGVSITQRTPLTYEGRTFKVVSVLEVDENKRAVRVLAHERTN